MAAQRTPLSVVPVPPLQLNPYLAGILSKRGSMFLTTAQYVFSHSVKQPLTKAAGPLQYVAVAWATSLDYLDWGDVPTN